MPVIEKITCFSCGQLNAFSPEMLKESAPLTGQLALDCTQCGEALLTGGARDVDPEMLERASRRDTLPLVVGVWAPWSRPSRVMTPQFATAARRMRGRARMVRLNADALPLTDRRYKVRGFPVMIAYRNGREIARHLGAQPSDRIAAWVRHL
jgi:thioredoxin 2